ncbi:putative histone acetyltransferase, partial [Gaertneriomyces semiglobifer]
KYKRVLHEEQTGLVKFQLAHNDGAKGNLILLSKLKQVIQAQLPKMPREYISRIVYSREHYSYVIVRDTGEVIAGITFRPFVERKFAEIVFLAVLSDFQTGGYGARLIAHFKDYVRQQFGIEHLLTYADNFAIGFFKKQGFTSEITLDKAIWVGYIKDYEGATLLQCTFLPKVQYLQIYSYYAEHRKAVLQRIREGLRSHVVHPGIEAFREEGAAVDPSTIPGLLEAGWTPEMEEKGYMDGDPKTPLYHMLVQLLTELRESPHSWPFLEPVAGVPDYYEIIKQPMDLRTMGERLADDKYQTAEDFEADFSLIVKNCKIYNDDGTQYVRCANRLEKFFRERLKALMLLYE